MNLNIAKFIDSDLILNEQLRSVRQKLESDLQGSNKRLAELVDQCEALKKGREESVSILSIAELMLE